MHRVKNVRTMFRWSLSEASAAASLLTREREQCAKIARQFSEEAGAAILKRGEPDSQS
jgi:hypothetical protein